MKKTPNIAIIGGLGSGKTTLANILVEELGYIKHSFAKEVKYIGTLIDPNITVTEENKAEKRRFWQDIGEILKKRPEYLNDSDKKKIDEWKRISCDNNPDGFNFLQYYKDNIDKMFNPTFYYNKLFANPMFSYDFINGKAVVDDMRFIVEGCLWQNEKNDTHNLIIKCHVSDEERIRRITARDKTFNPEWLKNSSEMEWYKIKYDYVIDNEQPLEKVKKELIHIAEFL